jgi:hypothetical protein
MRFTNARASFIWPVSQVRSVKITVETASAGAFAPLLLGAISA